MKRLTIGILAHVDAGKTTLSEAVLYLTGSIRRLGRVDNRDAFFDTYELERSRGITIFSKQAVFSLGDAQVTLVDTPGHADFSSEMERTLQVLDYAILVVSGADGVQGHTETLWRLLKRYRIPVFIFVNKMDQPGTDEEQILTVLKNRLSSGIAAFGRLGIRDFEVIPAADGGKEQLEELAMCDEALLETYLQKGSLEIERVRQAVRARKAFPCYFGSALKLTGIETLLKGIELFSEYPVYPEQFGARVFKVSRDTQGNRLTHVKITGGTLKVKEPLGSQESGKINQIRIYSGTKYETPREAEAGVVCAVTGPADTRPGQGFGIEGESNVPLLEPVLTYRILLPEGCDAHRMLQNLRMLEEEDPLLHIVWNEGTGEIQAQVMGEVQMEVLKSQIRERFSVEAEFGTGSIIYKETILRPAEGVGHFEPLRHYAEVHLLLEPGEPGSGLAFGTDCSEDMLDRNWQRLVLTHLEEKRHRGVLTGSEITDMKITLLAGRAHIKHTEGGDFRQAVYRAVRQGLMEAGCRVLEPCYDFALEIPEEALGRAMTDIERFQGRFEAPFVENGMMVLRGSAPVASMRDYQREVTSYTRGRGRLSLSLKGYEPCHDETEVIERIGYDFEADFQDPAGSVFCSHGAGFTVPWNEVKKYMHVESPAEKLRLLTGILPVISDTGQKDSASDVHKRAQGEERPGRSWAEDKELEEIFTRTYGPLRRNDLSGKDSRKIIRARETAVVPKRVEPGKEPKEEYLLVDGYNIIFAWDGLRELAEANIDGARHRLMDILCNYQGFRKCTLLVVFDAYKVAGNMGEVSKYHNIHVVYTKEAETADQYIEKLAHRIGQSHQVTVATSDGLEQLIIRSQGCLLMSAKDFREETERVNALISEEKSRLTGTGKNYLLSYAEGETKEYLENVRLGKEEGVERKKGKGGRKRHNSGQRQMPKGKGS